MVAHDWPWARDHRAAIAAHWEERRAARPAMFNGTVLMLRRWTLARGVLEAELFEAQYAALTALKDWGFPDGGVLNVFAAAVPRTRDGTFLLGEMGLREPEPAPRDTRNPLIRFLDSTGRRVTRGGGEVLAGLAFLGEVVAAAGRVARRPQSFRLAALVNQLEQVAFRGVPIIVLISFLVGGIVAQQGIFQLQRFGAQSFVVNLIGLLILRELGVLLTSIMVAGRSGSAFTAEIGSMRMREEVDALRVMGLDPVEILILPRILALVIGLPILAFLGSLAALAGGGLTAALYGGMTVDAFLARLQAAVSFHHFAVGLIKAPFMALTIGIIATIEGFAVEGSAESLGRHVTASVVKSIFMVIVLDGLFAVFFAAINF